MSRRPTPGPWEVSHQPQNPGAFYVWTVRDRDDARCVATVKPTQNPGQTLQDAIDRKHDIGLDEARANAIAIAALPDLLAASSRALQFLADNFSDFDMPDILPALRAAVAKAGTLPDQRRADMDSYFDDGGDRRGAMGEA